MSNVDDHPGSVTLGGVQQGVGHEQRPNLFGVDLVVLGVCPGAGRRATLGSACGRRDEIERAEALGGVIDVSTKETESGPGRGARGTPANRRRRPALAREDLAHVVGIGLRLPPTWSGCATDVVVMQMAENDDLDVLGVHAGGSKLVPKTSASGEPTAHPVSTARFGFPSGGGSSCATARPAVRRRRPESERGTAPNHRPARRGRAPPAARDGRRSHSHSGSTCTLPTVGGRNGHLFDRLLPGARYRDRVSRSRRGGGKARHTRPRPGGPGSFARSCGHG